MKKLQKCRWCKIFGVQYISRAPVSLVYILIEKSAPVCIRTPGPPRNFMLFHHIFSCIIPEVGVGLVTGVRFINTEPPKVVHTIMIQQSTLTLLAKIFTTGPGPFAQFCDPIRVCVCVCVWHARACKRACMRFTSLLI